MNRFLGSVVDVVVDRTPEQLIAAILIALVLSLGMATAFALLRQKMTDTTMLLTCLAMVVNIAGMTVAAGFVHSMKRVDEPGFRGSVPPGSMGEIGAGWRGQPGEGRSGSMARRIIEGADTNGDGKLSVDEASEAASMFVKETEEGRENGRIDEEVLRQAIRSRLLSPPFPPPHQGAAEPQIQAKASIPSEETRDRPQPPPDEVR